MLLLRAGGLGATPIGKISVPLHSSNLHRDLTYNLGEHLVPSSHRTSGRRSGSCAAGTYLGDCSAAYVSVSRSLWVCQSGTISRLNYANSESMSAIISFSGLLTLTFGQFNTEKNYDKLTVLSCIDVTCSNTVTLLDHYSGYSAPGSITCSTGFIQLVWTSDGSITFTGWSATWTTSGQLRLSNYSNLIARCPFL